MTEGAPKAPHLKGRRNPEITAALLAEQLEEEAAASEVQDIDLGDGVDDGTEDVGFIFVRRGRRIYAKQSSPFMLGRGEDAHYFTFGLEDDVDPDADLGPIFEEIADICREAVFGMAGATQAKLDELYAQPITPRR